MKIKRASCIFANHLAQLKMRFTKNVFDWLNVAVFIMFTFFFIFLMHGLVVWHFVLADLFFYLDEQTTDFWRMQREGSSATAQLLPATEGKVLVLHPIIWAKGYVA